MAYRIALLLTLLVCGKVAAAPPADGAASWWAARPLRCPPVPVARTATGAVSHPIDAFLQARLRAAGLQAAPEADRATLIRRLTFDLHGLPPAPEEVAAFVSDPSPDACERLVDRLLASPRYGERMARLWLDVVHYGESNGFGMDRPRLNAWPYRDYVIRAFNEDRPYARFVEEQLAADTLFPDEPALIPALGFAAAGPFNQSALAEQVDGTLCKQIALNLDRDDMVTSVAATFLSVTLHCARCHDHKFDPISMRDYYRMQAVFAGVVRGEREHEPDPASARERRRWRAVREKLLAGGAWDTLSPKDQAGLGDELKATEKALLASEKGWHPLAITAISDAGAKTVPLPDGSVRLEGGATDRDTYVLAAREARPTAALRLEVLADDLLPHRGPGRSPVNGNFHLSEIKVLAAPAKEPEKIQPLKIRAAFTDFSQAGWEVGKAIDGKPETAWGIHPEEGRSHQAVFLLEKPATHPGGTVFTVRLEQLHGGAHLIGRLRLSTSDRAPAEAEVISPDVLSMLGTPPGRRTEQDRKRVQTALARLVVERKLSALPPPAKVFAIGHDLPAYRRYRPPAEPYPIRILDRGDVTRPLAEVRPGGLEALATLPVVFDLKDPRDEASRRAALARWISDPRNPLTWRSIANRVWGWHFERALVDTPNDLGHMGSPPSHPELLDWLASELLRSGGSLKHLHRLIVTSAAYRQSARGDAAAARVDPDNRLLWRAPRRRLDAEQLRDALLVVSGTLDATMGGPSAMQFQYSDPNREVSPRIDYDGFNPDSPASLRRGIYRFLFRNVNDPLLDAFDGSNPSLSTPRRDVTVTPLQALSLFNNRFVLRQCEHIAGRLQREEQDLPGQVGRAFWLLYSRVPTAEEARLVGEYARKHGLAAACRVLVNANEFLFLR